MVYMKILVYSNKIYLMKIANLLIRQERESAASRSIMIRRVKRDRVLRLNRLLLSTNLHTSITLTMQSRAISLLTHLLRGDQCHKITQITDLVQGKDPMMHMGIMLYK